MKMLAIESFINWCDNMLIAEEASAKENILLLSTVVAAMAVPTAAYIGYAVKKIKAQTQSEKKAAEDLRKKISEERKQKARKEYEAYRDKMNRAEASVKVDSNYKSKVNQISTADRDKVGFYVQKQVIILMRRFVKTKEFLEIYGKYKDIYNFEPDDVSEYGVVLCSKSGGSTFSATYDYEDEEDCNKAREGYYDLLEIGFHFINDIFGDILDAANIQRYDDCGDGDESFFPIGYC